jgi:tetratricopeptide (TPR) repeat protein
MKQLIILLLIISVVSGCGVVYLKSQRQLDYEAKTGLLMRNHTIALYEAAQLYKNEKYMKTINLLTGKYFKETTQKSPILLGYLASAYIKTDYFGSAYLATERMIEIDPSFPWSYYLKGYLFYKGGKTTEDREEATRLYEKAIRLTKVFINDEEMTLMYGDLYMHGRSRTTIEQHNIWMEKARKQIIYMKESK